MVARTLKPTCETALSTLRWSGAADAADATAVMNEGKMIGIITDGDLRRMLEKNDHISGIRAKDIMTANPKTIQSGSLVVEALSLMRKHNITQLPVLDNDKYVGVIHLHDILKEGIL